MEKIKEAIKRMREHHASWYDQESINRFNEALFFVVNVNELKFFAKQTEIIDEEDEYEIYGGPHSLFMWQGEIEGAPKLHELVRARILNLSREKAFLDELSIDDARFLLSIVNPLYNDDLKFKYGDLARKLETKLPTEKAEELKQEHIAHTEVFPKMTYPEKLDRAIDLLLSHQDDDFTKSKQRNLFFDDLDEIDAFFKGKEKEVSIIEPLAFYKKLLRKSIKSFDFSKLENLYHETLYNGVSSKVILERYKALLNRNCKKMLPQEVNEKKLKLELFRKANRK